MLGHILVDSIAIIIGANIHSFLPEEILKIITGAIFIILGIYMYLKVKKIIKTKKKKRIFKNISPFLAVFLLISLSEFGDKSQIASGLLATKFGFIATIIGAILGLATIIAISVFIGAKIAKKLPREKIKIATAIVFIIMGILTIIF
ncbi:TMEM165/GDT1 family protein [Candidatus Woesearchaeota archaeon]|nr:TMEM165/GDT1 family protein [Candidatus Woesearchaeota archaeon]